MASFIRSAMSIGVSISRSVVPKICRPASLRHFVFTQSPNGWLHHLQSLFHQGWQQEFTDDKVLMLDVKRKCWISWNGKVRCQTGDVRRPSCGDISYSTFLTESTTQTALATIFTTQKNDLAYDGTVSVITVRKVRLLLAEIDASETSPEILYRKEKMERLVASESDKSFVWILASWIVSLKQKSLQRHQREAHALGHTAPTRFKRA
ncbi:hypothetical protein PSHT_14887 [Puccinia striiformis]|uniref:Uncharacterized protein n=1 Tax=Puccinia striiformis TaxID=27350 RepID=A0A2S4UI22_9BASI|nr:hypothetical protein PSHT_14887 [Puccinia striiformis]